MIKLFEWASLRVFIAKIRARATQCSKVWGRCPHPVDRLPCSRSNPSLSVHVMFWSFLQENVFGRESGVDLFNPYNGWNPDLDISGADQVRRSNLKSYLEDHDSGVKLLLVAEAPGPWGCRFSGVPITSEEQLVDRQFPASGRKTSLAEVPHAEYSARIYWGALQPYYSQILTWNSVPFHPHRKGKPLSIRPPRVSEVNSFLPVLEAVVGFSRASRVVAIGRKAENALQHIACDATYIRHPSQGGATLFRNGIRDVLDELGIVQSETSHAT